MTIRILAVCVGLALIALTAYLVTMEETVGGRETPAPAGDEAAAPAPGGAAGGAAGTTAPEGEALFTDGFAKPLDCEQACRFIAKECPAAVLASVGGDRDGCRTACEARVAEDVGWIANYVCLADLAESETATCRLAPCFPDEAPLAPPSYCTAACAVLERCGAFPLLPYFGGRGDRCAPRCAGAAVADPEFRVTIECVARLDPTRCGAAREAIPACDTAENDP